MLVPPDSRGALLAASLEGSWRVRTDAYAGSARDLEEVAPLLVSSGAAALAWRKASRAPLLRDTQAALALRHAYRSQTIRNALREKEIAEVFSLLESVGVEAILIKGWAAARVYTEAGLRPFGDIDVCVPPGKYLLAADALLPLAKRIGMIDVHEGFDESDERPFEELFARSLALDLCGAKIRVLSEEDHLRLLCVHLLRHGAWRPLWLCDVAAALEARSSAFDWELLLGEDARRARWIACAVGLSEKLLGARTVGTPFEGEGRKLPRWLVSEVLKQWETPTPSSHGTQRHRAPMSAYLRRPAGVFSDLRNRWPNPIEATVRLGGPFNALPRLPFQLGYAFSRAARFFARLPRTHRAQH